MKFSDKYECRPYYFNPYRNPHYSTWEFPGGSNQSGGGAGQLTNNFGKFHDHHENLETMKNQETIETLLKNLMLRLGWNPWIRAPPLIIGIKIVRGSKIQGIDPSRGQNSEKNDQIKNEINRRKAKKEIQNWYTELPNISSPNHF